MAAFDDGTFFLSANPTLAPYGQAGGGPARPEVLAFSRANLGAGFRTLLPHWDGTPKFTEHSYRTFASDGPNRELLLFQNVGDTHAEWTFLDREGQWSARGQLVWPWGAEYDQPKPVRICYPTVMLKDRAVFFCGVSDVLEPYQQWRDYKKQLTGRDWDYDFRRLFFTWSRDIRSGKFQPWVEIASRDKTAGWIFPGDLWVATDGLVHVIWTERAIDERLREKFFPKAQQTHALNYAAIREGQVLLRRTLAEAREGRSGEVPSSPRFQVTAENRLIVFFFVQGTNAVGQTVAENRLMEIGPDGGTSVPVRIDLKQPFTAGFTATVRAGSPPSDTLEILGQQMGHQNTMRYARIHLFARANTDVQNDR